MSNELRPCPFCGTNAVLSTFSIDVYNWYEENIHCEVCKCSIDHPRAITIWNTRPAEDALQAEIAKLATELNNINILVDMILRRANFGSKATKAEMHERLTSIYVYASQIKRALARTDGELDTGKIGDQEQ